MGLGQRLPGQEVGRWKGLQVNGFLILCLDFLVVSFQLLFDKIICVINKMLIWSDALFAKIARNLWIV